MTCEVIYSNPPAANCGPIKQDGKFDVPENGYCVVTVLQTAGIALQIAALVPSTAEFVPYQVGDQEVWVGEGYDTKVTVLQPGTYQVVVPAGLENEDIRIISCCYENSTPLAGLGDTNLNPATVTGIGVDVLDGYQVTADGRPVYVQSTVTADGTIVNTYYAISPVDGSLEVIAPADISPLIETPLGIELGSLEVGCTKDANGAITGKVYLVLIRDEANTTTTTELQHISFATGNITAPYVGPIEVCSSFRDIHPTGLCDELTQAPVLADFDGVNTSFFYYHPTTGVKTMTTTGFTGAKPTTETETQVAYETLASGVVERIKVYTPIVDGVPDAANTTYLKFSDNTAYAPVDVARIAPKPQKVQMGTEDLAVTGAGVALAAVPTAANSDGDNFPDNALVHVHVDSSDNAAGIAYTTNGVNPSEATEFERSEGQPIILDTHEEIVGFRAAPLDASGDLAPAETIQVSVEYNNIGADKDDV